MTLGFYELGWKARMLCFSFLDIDDVYYIGCCSRKLFLCFQREKCSRKYFVDYNRFLGNGRRRETVALISYPRSGNSYFRKLLESVTSIATGSDNRIHRSLSASLLEFGFQGEGIGDESVWIIKSHFPERMGFIRFPANRILLLVRNPFDAIESYFHMAMTNTHNKSLSQENIWESFALNEIKVWLKFYQFWSKRSLTVPTLFLRYEDILENKERSMEVVMTFLCNGKVPIGFNIPQNITNKLTRETVGKNTMKDLNNVSDNNNDINITINDNNCNNNSNNAAITTDTYTNQPVKHLIDKITTISNNETNTSTNDLPVTSGPGYSPRQGTQPGKSLKQFTDSMMKECLLLTNDTLVQLGYQISKVVETDTLSVSTCHSSRYTLSIDTFHPIKAISYLNNLNKLNSDTVSPQYTKSNVNEVSEKWVVVNERNMGIRDTDDKFGREISSIRRELTDNDRLPFPTL